MATLDDEKIVLDKNKINSLNNFVQSILPNTENGCKERFCPGF